MSKKGDEMQRGIEGIIENGDDGIYGNRNEREIARIMILVPGDLISCAAGRAESRSPFGLR